MAFSVHVNQIVKLTTEELLDAIGNLICLFVRKDNFAETHPFHVKLYRVSSLSSETLRPYLTTRELIEGLRVMSLPLSGPGTTDWAITSRELGTLVNGFLSADVFDTGFDTEAFKDWEPEVTEYLESLIPSLQPMLATFDVFDDALDGEVDTAEEDSLETLESLGYKVVKSALPLVRPGSVVTVTPVGDPASPKEVRPVPLRVLYISGDTYPKVEGDLVLDVEDANADPSKGRQTWRIRLSTVTSVVEY